MTVKDLNERLQELINEWNNGFVPLYIATSSVKASMAVRIFDEGKNSKGTQLPKPDYSTKPLYADVNSLPSTPSSFMVGKTGKKIKSAYFPQGYKQLKQAIGRPVLELTNQLDLSFSNTTYIKAGAYETQIIIEDSQVGKVEGLEHKYGAIFSLTDEEETELVDVIEFEIQKALNNSIG